MGETEFLQAMGRRVSARRRELHLTQEQVAEQMDVSLQMISNLELGKKAIRPANLLKLSHVLRISADYLLSGQRSDAELSEIGQKVARLSPEHQRIIGELIDSLIVERES